MTTENNSSEAEDRGTANIQSGTETPCSDSAPARSEEHHPETVPHSGEPNQDQKHWLEYATAGFALVAALGSASAVIVGYWQWGVMGKQAEIANIQTQIAEAEHRPWISANPITLVDDMLHNDGGLKMTMQFTIKNTGHSPARRVFVAFRPSLYGWDGNAHAKVCEMAEDGMHGMFSGVAVFPGDTVIQSMSYVVAESQFIERKAEFENNNGGKTPGVLVSIIACVAYKDMETEKFHHTPYDFYMGSSDEKIPVFDVLANRGPIHASAVALVSMPVGPPPD